MLKLLKWNFVGYSSSKKKNSVLKNVVYFLQLLYQTSCPAKSAMCWIAALFSSRWQKRKPCTSVTKASGLPEPRQSSNTNQPQLQGSKISRLKPKKRLGSSACACRSIIILSFYHLVFRMVHGSTKLTPNTNQTPTKIWWLHPVLESRKILTDTRV